MNGSTAKATFYEAFNARALSPSEVARTFVPSEHFRKLVKRCHSVIVGPRGSGKTTLLKMLEPAALSSWEHSDGEYYRATVDFTGVFVATDVTWKAQLESLSREGFSDQERRVLVSAAFTAHVQRSLVAAMLQRVDAASRPFPHRHVALSREQEAELVRGIAAAWQIAPTLPTLVSLKHSLNKRLSEIKGIAVAESICDQTGRGERLAGIGFLSLWYLEAVVVAIDMFNDLVGETDAHWALLFDELELAPDWIRRHLIQATRSVDSRLLFKLSISPYDEHVPHGNLFGPMEDNDYEPIPLWFAKKEDGYAFCKTLWESLLRQRGLSEATAESTLGPSIFSTSDVDSSATSAVKARYAPRSPHHKRFVDLAREDRTFAEYLKQKQIALDSLSEGAESARAADIRKIIALVAVRHTFRTPDSAKGKQRVRSRKNPQLYVGAESVFAMVEANPRWLIAVGSRLLETMDPVTGVIPAGAQNRELVNAARRFQAMLETIPLGGSSEDSAVDSVASIISTIGEFLFKSAVLDDFNPEPPGSIIVDTQVSSTALDSIGKALNVGALVAVPDESGSALLGNLVGCRVRMSYLLAAVYRYPLRLGRSVSLTHIRTRAVCRGMSAGEDSSASSSEPDGQLRLFEE